MELDDREKERREGERMSERALQPSEPLSISNFPVSPKQPTEPIICDPSLPGGGSTENTPQEQKERGMLTAGHNDGTSPGPFKKMPLPPENFFPEVLEKFYAPFKT